MVRLTFPLLTSLLWIGCSSKKEEAPTSTPGGLNPVRQPSAQSTTAAGGNPGVKSETLGLVATVPVPQPQRQYTQPGGVDFDGCRPRVLYAPAYAESYDLDGTLLSAEPIQPPVLGKFRWNGKDCVVRPTYAPADQRVVDPLAWPPENQAVVEALQSIRKSGATPEAVGRCRIEPGIASVRSVDVVGETAYINHEFWSRRSGTAASPQFFYSVIEGGRYAGGGAGKAVPVSGFLVHLSGRGGDLCVRRSIADQDLWKAKDVLGFVAIPGRSEIAVWTDRELRLHDAGSGRCLATIEEASIVEVLPSPDGKLVAVESSKGLLLFDRGGKRTAEYTRGTSGGRNALGFCAKGDHLVMAQGNPRKLVVYDGAFGERPAIYLDVPRVADLFSSADESRFRILDSTRTRMQEWRVDLSRKRLVFERESEWREGITVSPDWILEPSPVRGGKRSEEATLYSTRDGTTRGSLKLGDPENSSLGMLSRKMAVFHVQVQGKLKSLEIHALSEGRRKRVELPEALKSAWSCYVSAVGGELLLVLHADTRGARVRETLFDASGGELREMRRFESPGGRLSPKGEFLTLTGDRGWLRVERSASAEKVVDLPLGWSPDAAYSPEERHAASVTPQGLCVVNLERKTVLPLLRTSGHRVCFLSERKMLVVGSASLDVVEIAGE